MCLCGDWFPVGRQGAKPGPTATVQPYNGERGCRGTGLGLHGGSRVGADSEKTGLWLRGSRDLWEGATN